MSEPVCPTPCDDDCEADCHEYHQVPWKRWHDPETCPGYREDYVQKIIDRRKQTREFIDRAMKESDG